MANKKIKHIVAKLLGESTEETLDIYDESALHATDIVDNLTSTDATKVLSAKQGKALNDSLTNLGVRATANTNYVGTNSVFVLRIGNFVVISGRFHVDTEKAAGQSNTLFTGLPIPQGSIVPVVCDNTDIQGKPLIVNGSGHLSSNYAIPVNWYNIFVAYSTT